MKKIALLIISLFFVTGCTNQDLVFNAFDGTSIANFMQSDQKTEEDLPKSEDQEKIAAYEAGFLVTIENLSYLEKEISEFFIYFETLHDKKWETEISKRKYQSTTVIKDISKLTPPKGWESFHSELIRMAKDYDRALNLLEQYIENDRKLHYLQASKNALLHGEARQNYLLNIFHNGVPERIQWSTETIFN